jgi:hypothetical protein
VPAPTAAEGTAPQSRFLFGTLLTDASRAGQEAAAGIRVVELELGWDHYEPRDGVFSASYAAEARKRLTAMRAAGMQVVLGVGLQYPPAWVFNYPNSRYKDQWGHSAGAIVNLTWNQVLRKKAAAYIARINADLGLNSFAAIRIGNGGLAESVFPQEGALGSFWAYDGNAQIATPFRGWKPGSRTWRGVAFTTRQVSRWYDWYVGSLADTLNWQLEAYRSLGFSGDLQVLMPGQGVRPLDYTRAIRGYLGGAGDQNRTVGRGAAWDRVLAKLTNRNRVVAYVSSIADGSGGDDLCQSGDRGVAPSSSTVMAWSATRWISYLADRLGLAKNGENPGPGDVRQYSVVMSVAARQMASCGLQGLMWAHDRNLYDGTSGPTLQDYATVIRSY